MLTEDPYFDRPYLACNENRGHHYHSHDSHFQSTKSLMYKTYVFLDHLSFGDKVLQCYLTLFYRS